MLLEFSCSNHKSIKDKVVLSMIAGKDSTFEDDLLHYRNLRILRQAVIYGANGSGKSNLVDAIQFVKNLVVNSINHRSGEGILQVPHKLLGFEHDSIYRIQFVAEGVRYAYGFTLRNMLVTDEYLYYFPNGRQVKIFERLENDSYKEGDRFKNKFEACQSVLKPNRLFLSCAEDRSKVYEIHQAFSFFRNQLVIYRESDVNNWFEYSMQIMHQSSAVKNAVISFMRGLGAQIKDISIKITKEDLDVSLLPPFLSDEFKANIARNVNKIDVQIIYDKFSIDFYHESSGVQKLLKFLVPLINIIRTGKVLVCDEIEATLHEAIVYKLVSLFGKIKASNLPQIIFTTHDTSILSLDLFRRDQIWFTELKLEDRGTDFYSLVEIKNVRKDDNIARGYIAGKYGAIPMLNVDLAKIISELQEDGGNGA